MGKLGGGIAQTCLVVIDGLCEAEVHRPDHGNTIASFLAKHLAKFPEWLKVKILSFSRNNEASST